MTNASKSSSEEYLSQILQKYSFAEVIEEEKRLTNEIRNIDVQMQKMVYENYSNFIETNKLLTGLKPELVSVQNTLNEITESIRQSRDQSTKIRSMIMKEQPEIKSMIEKQATIDKIDAISRLPSQMRTHLDKREYMLVIEDFRSHKNFFEKFGEFNQVKVVEQRCQEIINECESELLKIIKNVETQTPACVSMSLDVLFAIYNNNTEELEQKLLSLIIDKVEEAFYTTENSSFQLMSDEFIDLTLPKLSKALISIESKILRTIRRQSLKNLIIGRSRDLISEKFVENLDSMREIFKNNKAPMKNEQFIKILSQIIIESKKLQNCADIRLELMHQVSQFCLNVFQINMEKNKVEFLSGCNEAIARMQQIYDKDDLQECNPSAFCTDLTYTILNSYHSIFDDFKDLSQSQYGFINLPNFFHSLSPIVSQLIKDIFDDLIGETHSLIADTYNCDSFKSCIFIFVIFYWSTNFFGSSVASFVEIANVQLGLPSQCSINLDSSIKAFLTNEYKNYLQTKFVDSIAAILFATVKKSLSKNASSYKNEPETTRSAFSNLNKSIRDFKNAYDQISIKINLKPKNSSFKQSSSLQAYDIKFNRSCHIKSLEQVFYSEKSTMTAIMSSFLKSVQNELNHVALNVHGVHQLQLDLKFIETNIVEIFQDKMYFEQIDFNEIDIILRKRCIDANLVMLNETALQNLLNNS